MPAYVPDINFGRFLHDALTRGLIVTKATIGSEEVFYNGGDPTVRRERLLNAHTASNLYDFGISKNPVHIGIMADMNKVADTSIIFAREYRNSMRKFETLKGYLYTSLKPSNAVEEIRGRLDTELLSLMLDDDGKPLAEK